MGSSSCTRLAWPARLRETQAGTAEMVFVELPGAPHAWPRDDYDATAELVAFLLRQSR